ncbi:MAG: hypothetical protein HY269_06975, partial [Deltaproteobacteria bacterium]|nr:hypothetical protein [Deltaproteobacteria bacterium]
CWAQVVAIDSCDSLDGWKLVSSDGVEGKLSLVPGVEGQAVRLDFDFRRGAGFCVLRHEFKRKLDENYRFSCDVRGTGPTNQLEFKLIDASGDNVWWVRQGEFEFPPDWRRLTFKKRHFQFAWGPSGGKPLEEAAAIEIAVAAHDGGQGYLLLDRLTYVALPAPTSAPLQARLLDIKPPANVRMRPIEIAADGAVEWHSGAGVEQPAFRIDLQQVREIGGLMIEWDNADFPSDYAIELLAGNEPARSITKRQRTRGGREYIRLEPTEASAVEIHISKVAANGVGVKAIRILPVEFAESLNAAYDTIAHDAPRGMFPRYCIGRQAYWTVVGDMDDEREILIDADGAVEIEKRGPRLEPFLFADGKLLTWADAETRQTLDQGCLPLPTVTRKHGELELAVSVLPPAANPDTATGKKSGNAAAVYRVTNHGKSRKRGNLFIAGRPFQILPPWQQLNISGGAISLPSILVNDQLVVLGNRPIGPWQRADAFGISRFDDGDVTEFLSRGVVPPRQGIEGEAQPASCAWRFDFELAAGASRTVVFTLPMPRLLEEDLCGASDVDASTQVEKKLAAARLYWSGELNRVKLELPGSAAGLVNAFRTAQAHILINADGPATQPGSRTYERSWIRDGAVTATSWFYTGRADRALRFANWYGEHLYPDGKVPCVVDRRGPDPVPENDSNGEYLYLLWRCYQFTSDKAFLERNAEHAIAAVNYIDTLRKQRMTEIYRNGTPEQRACFGLMPESISHEGYSAKPMHSYWDDLWTLRGLKDAVRIAGVLQRDELVQKWTKARDEFEQALGASLK